MFVAFSVTFDGFPASATIARLSNGSTWQGNLYLSNTSGTLQLRTNTTSLGSTTLSVGTRYRLGLRQTIGSGTAVLEAFIAQNDDAFPATPFASASSLTIASTPTAFDIGATGTSAVNARFDDIRLDRGSMPGPSGMALAPPSGRGNVLAAPLRQGGTRIKDSTFEGGSLIGSQGADSASSTVTLESAAPLKGAYSARVPNAIGYLRSNLSGQSTLYGSFYLRLTSVPGSATIARISASGSLQGGLYLTSSGTLQLRNNTSTIGSAVALTVGTLYRVGLRQTLGSGTGVLEGYLVNVTSAGDIAFGSAFASSSGLTLTGSPSSFDAGATGTTAVDLLLDDIRLDSAVMPGPSGSGTPTATPTVTTTPTRTPTPTNTPTGPTNTPTRTATPTNTPTGPTATPTSTPTNGGSSTRVITYGYDGLQRLIGAAEAPGSTFAYTYDLAGNRTDGGKTYNAANQISNAGYTYDAAGNLTADGTITYSYDALGRMTAHSDTTATYNGDGTLVAQTIGGTTTLYTQDLAAPLTQVLQTTQGRGTTQYLYGDARLAYFIGGGWLWYGADALGSVRMTLDGTGAPFSTLNYDPWGAVEDGGDVMTFGFTGELQEMRQTQQGTSNGLVNLRARWYSTRQGRFTSVDPFAGLPETPYSQHQYQYGYSDPVLNRDPSGRCATTWTDVADCPIAQAAATAVSLYGTAAACVASGVCALAVGAVALGGLIVLGVACEAQYTCPGYQGTYTGPPPFPAPGPAVPTPGASPAPPTATPVPSGGAVAAPVPIPSSRLVPGTVARTDCDVQTRTRSRPSGVYVADSNIFLDNVSGDPVLREYIDAEIFTNPGITLYLAPAAVEEVFQGPVSFTELERLHGFPGGARIIPIPEADLTGVDFRRRTEGGLISRNFGVRDARLVKAAIGQGVPLLTTNKARLLMQISGEGMNSRQYLAFGAVRLVHPYEIR